MRNHSKSRLSVLIKSNLNYTRMTDLENDDTSEIWIRMKLSKRKYFYLLCINRQWNLPSKLDPQDESGKLANKLDRLGKTLKPLEELHNKGHTIVLQVT